MEARKKGEVCGGWGNQKQREREREREERERERERERGLVRNLKL